MFYCKVVANPVRRADRIGAKERRHLFPTPPLWTETKIEEIKKERMRMKKLVMGLYKGLW